MNFLKTVVFIVFLNAGAWADSYSGEARLGQGREPVVINHYQIMDLLPPIPRLVKPYFNHGPLLFTLASVKALAVEVQTKGEDSLTLENPVVTQFRHALKFYRDGVNDMTTNFFERNQEDEETETHLFEKGLQVREQLSQIFSEIQKREDLIIDAVMTQEEQSAAARGIAHVQSLMVDKNPEAFDDTFEGTLEERYGYALQGLRQGHGPKKTYFTIKSYIYLLLVIAKNTLGAAVSQKIRNEIAKRDFNIELDLEHQYMSRIHEALCQEDLSNL